VSKWIAMLSTLVFAGACGSSSTVASTSFATTTAVTTSVSTTASTTASTTTSTTSTTAVTTTAPPALTQFPDQETAAQKLYAAWAKNNRAAAVGLADPVQLDALFRDHPPQSFTENRHCDTGEFGVATCFFANGQGGVSVSVTHTPAGPWMITGIVGT
jgi:hypothetical protein